LESIQKDTGFTPKALESRPEIHAWMYEFIRAFKLLSSRRAQGMGLSPICLADIVTYIDLYEIDDFDEFIRIICDMDMAFLIKSSAKTQQESKGTK
jgi:hypothetical protein